WGSVPGISNARVRIAFRRAGRDRWRAVHYTRTDAGGDFSAHVRAHHTGAYRVQPENGSAPSDGTPTAPSDPGAGGASNGSAGGTGASRPSHLRVVSRTRAWVKDAAVIGHPVRIRGRVKPGDAHRLVRAK